MAHRLGGAEPDGNHQIDRHDDGRHRQAEQNHQLPRLAACMILPVKEIGRHFNFRLWTYDLSFLPSHSTQPQ